ncbi:MAG: thioredoxin family protein [Candidatus Thorarchaeota archaeon]|jgi:thiol-disulfide isomerase/thioredoxin
MVDLADIRSRSYTVKDYIDTMKAETKDTILESYNNYNLDMDIAQQIKVIAADLTVVVLSAAWCGDCKVALPILLHLEEKINLEIRCFGGIKTAPLDPEHQWAIPPSPQEMDDWGVTAIPWLEFINSNGNRVGFIREKQTVKDTLEAEILHVLKNK